MTEEALESTSSRAAPSEDLGKVLKKSNLLLGLLILGFAAPLGLVPISGAVIAEGEVLALSRSKRIAHPSGGVVAQIYVSNAAKVHRGQPLLRLDTSLSEQNLEMTGGGIAQLTARVARLRTERDGLTQIQFPADLTAQRHKPEIARAIEEETRQFQVSMQTLQAERAAIKAQISQAMSAEASYRIQADVYRQQETLISEERRANDALWEKRFTTLQRRNELMRAAVGLRGSIASAEGQAAQMRERQVELRQQIYAVEEKARARAGIELSQVQLDLFELRQNRLSAQEVSRNGLLRAPYAGVVDKLAFTSVGDVVRGGETVLEIVPVGDPIIVSARVSPLEINEISLGKTAIIKFSDAQSRDLPELSGRVSKISASRNFDAQRNFYYYAVDIVMPKEEFGKIGLRNPKIGTPVEVFIQTGRRSLLAYFARPLADQINRMFR